MWTRGRKFFNPETDRQVQFQSLPSKEQQRYFQQWAPRHQQPREDPKREKAPKREENPKLKEDVDRRVDEFFGGFRGRSIPDNPLAVLQLMQFDGVLSKEDRAYFPHVLERIHDRIDQDDKEDEEREKKRTWWQRLTDTRASQKVASRWMRGIVATQLLAGQPSPKFKKLYIFDFDGTLFRSPTPPDGYGGDPDTWWSNPDSLGPPHVESKPDPDMWHPDSAERLREALADPDGYVVVMTGRYEKLQDRIQAILASAGLEPDELITNPEIGNTTRYKRDEMLYLLRQLPNVREVEFWEDKKADLKGYQKAAEKAGVGFTPKLVKNYEDEAPPYVGIFLTPEAKRKLLKDFPPKHPEVQADHVTLMFKPTPDQMEELRDRFRMGQTVPVKITGRAEDDKSQALTVELPGDFQERSKEQPHITVSVAEGVSPIYSNELLRGGAESIEPKVYSGYLDVGPRPSSPSSKDTSQTEAPQKGNSAKNEKQRMWLEFLKTETRNPEYGKPGHHKERVLRKTLYDSGGQGRHQVMREWGPYLQGRRSR